MVKAVKSSLFNAVWGLRKGLKPFQMSCNIGMMVSNHPGLINLDNASIIKKLFFYFPLLGEEVLPNYIPGAVLKLIDPPGTAAAVTLPADSNAIPPLPSPDDQC